MNDSPLRAPLGKILPSFMPTIIERGIPGYESVELIANEARLLPEQLRPLLTVSALIGSLNYAVEKEFDFDSTLDALINSINEVKELSSNEAKLAVDLANRFFNYHIIREDHPLDDWLCESLWKEFQTGNYSYPSAMSDVISYALNIKFSLQKCVLEY